MFSAAGCGDSGSGDGTMSGAFGAGAGYSIGDPVDLNGDGRTDGYAIDTNNDGVADAVDTNNDGLGDAALPAKPNGSNGGASGGGDTGVTPPMTSGGTNGQDDDDIFLGQDGGPDDNNNGGSSGPVVVTSSAEINCGGSVTEIDISANYACCETFTNMGWQGGMVKAETNCTAFDIPPFSQDVAKEEVVSTCDSKDDCGGDSYCCFYVGEMGPPPQSGIQRPQGRECMSEATCNAGGFQGGSGVFSCNDVSDCPKAFKSCVAEPTGATNAGRGGRSWVKICK
jgi:hypothetical protein